MTNNSDTGMKRLGYRAAPYNTAVPLVPRAAWIIPEGMKI